MSFEAIAWAMKQPVGRSSTKFLLVAMAECVNDKSEEMLCFPSIAHLAKATEMDPKSVKANLLKLRELGFIEDTGDRKGLTGRVVIYRLKEPKSGPIAEVVNGDQSAQISQVMSPNLGALREGEMSPNFPVNEPKFPDQSAQISQVMSPNLGHGTSKEPIKEPVIEPRKRAKVSFDAGAIELPDWLPADTWAMWVRDRADRRKSITEAGAKLQLRSLEKLRAQGHDPVLLIETAIASGWQGFFAAKDGSTMAARQDAADGVPLCPMDQLLDAYAEVLPMLPQPMRSLFVEGANAVAMRKRWEWVLTANRESGELAGQRMATNTDEGVAWFRRFFGYVARKCPYLLGENTVSWTADLGWLLTAGNFEKVLQGNYETQELGADHA